MHFVCLLACLLTIVDCLLFELLWNVFCWALMIASLANWPVYIVSFFSCDHLLLFLLQRKKIGQNQSNIWSHLSAHDFARMRCLPLSGLLVYYLYFTFSFFASFNRHWWSLNLSKSGSQKKVLTISPFATWAFLLFTWVFQTSSSSRV